MTAGSENRYWSSMWTYPPVEWHPRDGEGPGVPRFFVEAMDLVEKEAAGRGLTFIFNAGVNHLPPSGPNVIVFVLCDEHSLIPRYWSNVGSVLKCYGGKPFMGPGLLSQGPLLGMTSAVKNGLIAAKWTVSAVRALGAGGRRKGSLPQIISRIHHLPLGFHSPPVPATIPFHERKWDIFFAGSVFHTVPRSLLGLRIAKPKDASRRELIEALETLRTRHGNLNIRVGTTTSFVPHAKDSADGSPALPKDAYMSALGDTKICVAPRGTSFETYRHFEGAGMGCVVVSEALPPAEFYEKAPFLRVNRWREIIDLLPTLLADKQRIEQIHQDTCAWWHRYCTPRAVADLIIRGLKTDGILTGT